MENQTYTENVSQEITQTDTNDSQILEESVEVDSESISIVTGKVTKRYNNAVEYSATFYDSSGNPLKNTIVQCGVDTIIYGVNATTNSKGVALFMIPAGNGNHNLYLINPQTSDVVRDTIKVFDVLTGGKDITTYFNSGKTYTVLVHGNDGKPVKSGQKVTFYVNNKKYTAKTDSKGYAKLKISFNPGAYIITAQYGNYIVANKVIVKPILISLTQFGSKKLGKKFTYKVKLLNSKGKAFKNKKITIKFNKKTYKAKTNKKGIATFKLLTPKKSGVFNIVASYGKAKSTAQLTRFTA